MCHSLPRSNLGNVCRTVRKTISKKKDKSRTNVFPTTSHRIFRKDLNERVLPSSLEDVLLPEDIYSDGQLGSSTGAQNYGPSIQVGSRVPEEALPTIWSCPGIESAQKMALACRHYVQWSRMRRVGAELGKGCCNCGHPKSSGNQVFVVILRP